MAKHWLIQGYDGMEETFSRRVPLTNLGEGALQDLLQRLAARHLTDDEVVDASLRKSASGYAPHLELRQGDGWIETTGSGFHYVARIKDDA